MRPRLLLCLVIPLLVGTFTEASAQRYEAEIARYVVDPCLRIAAIYQDLDEQFGMTEAVATMKVMNPRALPAMVEAITPLLRGKSMEERKAIYAFGLKQCLDGAIK